jgi:NTE family protein
MATKNSLCWLVIFSLLQFSLVACQNFGLKTRSQIEQSKKISDTPEPTQNDLPQTFDNSQDMMSNPPVIEKPEFLKREAPRLGLILGGGGALSIAQVGVLQELEAQKVPIHSIAGVEWGALVAGSYAVKNKAHAVEWKLLKMPIDKFESHSLFTSGNKVVNVSQFSDFLNDVVGKASFSDLEIPFSCLSITTMHENIQINNRGSVKKAIESCWPYPPHFSVESHSANLVGIAELANYLRKNGAEIVVYIDVVSDNKIFSDGDRKKSAVNTMLWSQAKNIGDSLNHKLINEVIKVPLSGFNINSYKSLRALVRTGKIKSKEQVNSLVKKYAY